MAASDRSSPKAKQPPEGGLLSRVVVAPGIPGCSGKDQRIRNEAIAPRVLLTQARLHFGRRPRRSRRGFTGHFRDPPSCPNRFSGQCLWRDGNVNIAREPPHRLRSLNKAHGCGPQPSASAALPGVRAIRAGRTGLHEHLHDAAGNEKGLAVTYLLTPIVSGGP